MLVPLMSPASRAEMIRKLADIWKIDAEELAKRIATERDGETIYNTAHAMHEELYGPHV